MPLSASEIREQGKKEGRLEVLTKMGPTTRLNFGHKEMEKVDDRNQPEKAVDFPEAAQQSPRYVAEVDRHKENMEAMKGIKNVGEIHKEIHTHMYTLRKIKKDFETGQLEMNEGEGDGDEDEEK